MEKSQLVEGKTYYSPTIEEKAIFKGVYIREGSPEEKAIVKPIDTKMSFIYASTKDIKADSRITPDCYVMSLNVFLNYYREI